jgi:hypothetical protein
MNSFTKSIFIVLILASCEQKKETIEIIENINMGFMETFNNKGKKEFQLFFSTEQNCHCMDAKLLYKYFRFGNNIECNLLEIQVPEGCNEKYGIPVVRLLIGSPPNGRYNLRINTKGKSNTAILNITDTAFCVNFERNYNINLVGGHNRRIFDNTLWGAFSYNTESELTTGLALIDSLNALGAQSTSLEDGDYGFFSIKNGKANKSLDYIVPRFYPGKETAFVFDYNFDDEKLTKLLTKYKNQYGNLYIMVRTGKGFSFFSWR